MPLIPELGKLERYEAYAYRTRFTLPVHTVKDFIV